MKLNQNICRNEISDEIENGSSWVKTRSLGQMEKKPYACSRAHIFIPILMNLFRMFDDLNMFENELYKVKTRSEGQIKEKHCVRHRGHIFSPVLLKDVQNVCLDDISYDFENELC